MAGSTRIGPPRLEIVLVLTAVLIAVVCLSPAEAGGKYGDDPIPLPYSSEHHKGGRKLHRGKPSEPDIDDIPYTYEAADDYDDRYLDFEDDKYRAQDGGWQRNHPYRSYPQIDGSRPLEIKNTPDDKENSANIYRQLKRFKSAVERGRPLVDPRA